MRQGKLRSWGGRGGMGRTGVPLGWTSDIRPRVPCLSCPSLPQLFPQPVLLPYKSESSGLCAVGHVRVPLFSALSPGLGDTPPRAESVAMYEYGVWSWMTPETQEGECVPPPRAWTCPVSCPILLEYQHWLRACRPPLTSHSFCRGWIRRQVGYPTQILSLWWDPGT